MDPGMPRNLTETKASNAHTNVSSEQANNKKTFLERLWDKVEDENEANFCWQEPGFDGIVVKNRDAIKNYESFRRTMYDWGFRKKRMRYHTKTDYWSHSENKFRKEDSMNDFRLLKSILPKQGKRKKAESTTTTHDSSGGNQETEAGGKGASDAFQAAEGHTARTASVSSFLRAPGTEQESPCSLSTEAEPWIEWLSKASYCDGDDVQWNDVDGDCISMDSFKEGCSMDQVECVQHYKKRKSGAEKMSDEKGSHEQIDGTMSSRSTRVDGEVIQGTSTSAEHFPTLPFVQGPMSGKARVDGKDRVAVPPGANHLSNGGGLPALHEQAATHFWTIVNSFLCHHFYHVHHSHHRSCNKHVRSSSKSLRGMSSAVEDLDCLLRISRFASMPTWEHNPSHNQDDDTSFSIDTFIWNDFEKNVGFPEASDDALKEQKYWLKKKLQDLVSHHFVEEQVDRKGDCEASLAAIKALSYQLEGLRRISTGRRRQQQLMHHRSNNDDDDHGGDDDNDDTINNNGSADMDREDSGGDHVFGGGNSGSNILGGGGNGSTFSGGSGYVSTFSGGSNGGVDIIGGGDGGDDGGDNIFTNGDGLGIIHEHADDNNVSVGAKSIWKMGERVSSGDLSQHDDCGKDVVDIEGQGADVVTISAPLTCQQVLMEDGAVTAVGSYTSPLVGRLRTEERELDDQEDLDDIGKGDDDAEDGDADADNRISVYMSTLKRNNDSSFVEKKQEIPTTQSQRKQHNDNDNYDDNGNTGGSGHASSGGEGEYRDASDNEGVGDDYSYVYDDTSINNEEDDDDIDDNDEKGGYDVKVFIRNNENTTASAGMVYLPQNVASAEVSKEDVDVVLKGRMDGVQLGHDLDEDSPPETRIPRVPPPSQRLSGQMVRTTDGTSEKMVPMWRDFNWIEKTATMQTPRRYFAAVILREEGQNVVLGGMGKKIRKSFSSVESISVGAVDDAKNKNNRASPLHPPQQWTNPPKMARSRSAFGAAVVSTRRLPSNTATSLSVSVDGVSSVENRQIVVAGGYCDGRPTEIAEMCILTTNQWLHLPPLGLKRAGCAVTSLYSSGVMRGDDAHENDCSGRVYVVGGNAYGAFHDSVEWLDVAQQGSETKSVGWRFLASKMKRGRYDCAAVMVQSPGGGVVGSCNSDAGDDCGDASLRGLQLVVVGGAARGEWATNTVECFDFGRGQWHDLPPMKEARAGCAAVAIGRCIYVVGGRDEGFQSLPTTEYFDFQTQNWTRLLPVMSVPREGCAAVVMTENDNDNNDDDDDATVRHGIVVLGGYDGSTNTTHSSVELLEVHEQKCLATPPFAGAVDTFVAPLRGDVRAIEG